jgi:hypothetical protein
VEPDSGWTLSDAAARFRAARETAPGEWPGKVDVVCEVERHLDVPGAFSFLLEVLQDSRESDLARIEVCKVLRVTPMRSAEVAGRCVVALLAALADDDELVRQWAALGMAQVSDVGAAPEALAQRVVDPDEDAAVRHNALDSLRRRQMPGPCRAVLAIGAPDEPVLDEAVREALRAVQG